MTEILCVIPARAGSKRIPDKNIKELHGKPLIEYTILTAVTCKLIDHVVISTNIPSLVSYSYGHTHLSYHSRAEALCTDESPDIDVLRDVIANYGDKWDLVVYLRPTTPYRADYHINAAIKLMLSHDDDIGPTGLRSVELMSESPFKCFTLDTPWLTPILDDCVDKTDWPNQKVRAGWKPNGYIDICRPSQLAQGKLWGDWPLGYKTPHTPEIDTPDDWKYAEWWGRQFVDAPIRFGRRQIK